MKPLRCRRCGTPLSDGALSGNCPRCLGALAFSTAAQSPLEPPQPPSHGAEDLEFIRELGRGGMGVVYEARQPRLNRKVAVKMLLGGAWARPDGRLRFLAEAQAAARLRHPGIVTVYEIGERDGQPYLVLELIEGPSLAEVVRQHPVRPDRAARIVRQAAEAIAHAHASGILHRDLKPSNILLDADDSPHVTDFGLARQLDSESGLTRTGEVFGSPAYLAPESLIRPSTEVTSDVYSLGAILYELITGRPPFVAESVASTLHQVAHAEPVSPRLLNPAIPRDLETICLHCLQKSPRRRYASAAEFAADLARFQRAQPILARPVSNLEKVRLAACRNPALASVSIALAAAILIGSLSILLQWRKTESHRADLARHLYAADVAAAGMSIREGNIARARNLLNRHIPIGESPSSGPDLREFTWRTLAFRLRSDEVLTFGTLASLVTTVAVSQDGLYVAAGTQRTDAPQHPSLRVWSLTNPTKPPLSFPISNSVWSVAFAHHGQTVVSAGDDGLHLWNVADGTKFTGLPTLPAREVTVAGDRLVLSPNHPFLDVSAPHPLHLVDLSSREVTTLSIRGRHPALSPDGRYLAVLDPASSIQLFEMPSGRLRFTVATNHLLFRLRFSADGRFLTGAGQVTSARLWNLESPGSLPLRFPSSHNVWDAVLSHDARTLFTATSHQQIEIWDVQSGERRDTLQGHDNEVWSLALTPDGKHLVSGAKDQSVRLWSPQARPPAETIPLSRNHPIRISPDGRQILAFAETNGLGATTVWELSSPASDRSRARGVWQPKRVLPGVVHSFAPDHSGWLRLTVHPRPALEVIPAVSASPVRTIPLENSPPLLQIDQAVFAGNLGSLVCPDASGHFHRWSTTDGRPLGRWSDNTWIQRLQAQTNVAATQPRWIRTLAVSPSGRWMAVGPMGSRTGYLVDFDSHSSVPLHGHLDDIAALDFFQDGRVLASGSVDGTVRLWTVPDGIPAGELPGHLESVEGIQVSPDGRTLAAVTPGIEVVLWHLPTRRELLRLPHSEVFQQLRFSPDGSRLFFGATPGDLETTADRMEFWNAPFK